MSILTTEARNGPANAVNEPITKASTKAEMISLQYGGIWFATRRLTITTPFLPTLSPSGREPALERREGAERSAGSEAHFHGILQSLPNSGRLPRAGAIRCVRRA